MDRCLLTASVAGMILASHSAEQVRPAVISHLPTEEDLLLITLDYRDDVGSFSIATKRAKTTNVDIEFYTIGNGIGAREGWQGRKPQHRRQGHGAKRAAIYWLPQSSLQEVFSLAKLATSNCSVGQACNACMFPATTLRQQTATRTSPKA